MSDPTLDRDEEQLKAWVRGGLEARDRSLRLPPFARVWRESAVARPPAGVWRPAYAAFAAVAMVAIAFWLFLARQDEESAPPAAAGIDAELARRLSSPDYWRVPTDDLLAFAAPPLSAELPSPDGFQVSLEESLL